MNKKNFYIGIAVLVGLAFGTQALASFSFSSSAITGTASSTIDVGAGNTLSLQTTGNGAITTGTGTFTAGGDAVVTGTTELGEAPIVQGDLTTSTPNTIAHAVWSGTETPLNYQYAFLAQSSLTKSAGGGYANGGIYSIGQNAVGSLFTGTVYGINTVGENLSATGNAVILGLSASAYNRGASPTSYMAGLSVQAYQQTGATGTVADVYGILITPGTLSAGSINRSWGIRVNNPFASSTGTITSKIGINIAEQAAGTNNTNLLIGTTTTPTGNFNIYSTSTKNSYFAGPIAIGTPTPNANAVLDLTSTTKAFMPPRMTTAQRDAIASPTAGMVIYNTTTNKLNVYTTVWEAVTSS